ncbi:MAG: zinc metalloprotease HtpX [Myxococcota bacterium]
MRLNEERIQQQRWRNWIHSGLLLGALIGQAAALGWLLSGWFGVILAGALTAAGVMAGLRTSPWMVLRMYRATPLRPEQAPGLYRVLGVLTERAKLPRRPVLFYIPSSVPNAMSLGRRDASVVALTDGLIRRLSPRELTGVLAHEVSHIKHGDLVVMGVADSLSRITAVLGQVGLLMALFAFFFGWWQTVYVGLILGAGPTISTLLMMALSRQREFAADLGAVELTGDPRGLANALAKIERRSRLWDRVLGMPGQDPNPSLLRSHPATDQRLEMLRDLTVEGVAPIRHPIEPPQDFDEVQRPGRARAWGTWF